MNVNLMHVFNIMNQIYILSSESSIFETSQIEGKLKLKENIKFHLFISRGPCGDATAFGGGLKKHPDR